jgi:hypothetical protein
MSGYIGHRDSMGQGIDRTVIVIRLTVQITDIPIHLTIHISLTYDHLVHKVRFTSLHHMLTADLASVLKQPPSAT